LPSPTAGGGSVCSSVRRGDQERIQCALVIILWMFCLSHTVGGGLSLSLSLNLSLLTRRGGYVCCSVRRRGDQERIHWALTLFWIFCFVAFAFTLEVLPSHTGGSGLLSLRSMRSDCIGRRGTTRGW
jgi:hypothetical protein